MSDISIISLVLAIIALIISIIHLVLEYLSKLRTELPTIKISANNLPPYSNNEVKTHIIIENVGTSIAINPELSIDYSYSEGETYVALEDDPILALNETIERRVRLVEPPYGTHEIKFIVEVGKDSNRHSFTKTIEIIVE